MSTPSLPPLPPSPASLPRTSMVELFLHSRLLRVLLLGFLSLLLMIPLGSIKDVIAEREQTRAAAKTELSEQWGGPQTLAGPFLVLSYVVRHATQKDGKEVIETTIEQAVLLPEALDLKAQQTSEIRRRGLFELPVYRVAIEASGHFAVPSLASIGVADADILWNRTEVVVMLSDLRALTGGVRMQIAAQTLVFEPGGGSLLHGLPQGVAGPSTDGNGCCAALARSEGTGGAIHALWPLTAAPPEARFKLPLSFNGSDWLRFTPIARLTQVHLKGDWISPSFEGATLPRQREVNTTDITGFAADWEIPDLSRSFTQLWKEGAIPYEAVQQSSFGLRLFPAVDQYFMAHRAVKYAQLFIVLTFALYWLFELVGGVRLNPLQYLLVGAGLTTFYLLQLALSEHLGFPLAYLIASIAVTLQVTLYSWSALHKLWRALGIGAAMGGLYAYLYAALREENYALLTGAVAVFAMLSLIMWLTRRIDWSAKPTGSAA